MIKKIFAIIVCLVVFSQVALACEPEVFELCNGQTVVIQKVPQSKLVCVDTWIKTGSVNENDKNSGVAHFLEHLFFKGSKKYRQGEFEKILDGKGAVYNAATSKDFTHYYITIKKEDLALALDLQSDMLLNPAIPQNELDRERLVVLEEIARSKDSPNNIVFQNLNSILFRQHPYKRDVIGSDNVIKNITRREIFEFYDKWYTPSNMVTVIVGNVDKREALELVQASFNQPRGAVCQSEYAPEPFLNKIETKIVRGKYNTSYLEMAFKGCEFKDTKDAYALDVLSVILGQGATSYLYKALKENRNLVTYVDSGHYSLKDDSIFYISLGLNSENYSAAENEVIRQIGEIRSKGVTVEEVQKAKNILERSHIYGNESVEDIANSIGYNMVLGGDLQYYTDYIENVKKITEQDILRVANKYLDPNKMAVSLLVPEKARIGDNNSEQNKPAQLVQIAQPKITQIKPVSQVKPMQNKPVATNLVSPAKSIQVKPLSVSSKPVSQVKPIQNKPVATNLVSPAKSIQAKPLSVLPKPISQVKPIQNKPVAKNLVSPAKSTQAKPSSVSPKPVSQVKPIQIAKPNRVSWLAEGLVYNYKPVDVSCNVVETTTKENAKLIVETNKTADIVAVEIFIKGGEFLSNKVGLCDVLAKSLTRGTKDFSAQEISAQIENNGIVLIPSAGADYFHISMKSTKDDFDKAYGILKEVMNNANFPENEIRKAKGDILDEIKIQQDNPESVAMERFKSKIYPNTPYGVSFDQLKKSINTIIKPDILNYYNNYLVPENMVISVSGNVEVCDVQEKFDNFVNRQGKIVNQQDFQKHFVPLEKPEKSLLKKKTQAAWVVMGQRVPSLANEKDFATLKVINSILSGGMSSRLFSNLREKKGLAYEVGCTYPTLLDNSYFVLFIGTNPKNIEIVQKEFQNEINVLMTTKLSEEELCLAKQRLAGYLALIQETNAQRATQRGRYEILNKEYNFSDKYEKLVESVSADDIIEVANRYFKQPFVISIVEPYEYKAAEPVSAAKPVQTKQVPAKPLASIPKSIQVKSVVAGTKPVQPNPPKQVVKKIMAPKVETVSTKTVPATKKPVSPKVVSTAVKSIPSKQVVTKPVESKTKKTESVSKTK